MGNEHIAAKAPPGLHYVTMADNVELPVLDITHPLFISSINEESFDALSKKMTRMGKHLKKIPEFLKNFLGKRSYVMGGFFLKDDDFVSLNSIGTLMLKMGPGLIGGGMKRYLDRMASNSINGVSTRIRLRDMSEFQAAALLPQLKKAPRKNLCFVNIAGGTGCDSINTLILLHKQDPTLLKDRKIRIDILDQDASGPHYAAQSIEALKKPGAYFHGLDISSAHIDYDWNHPEKLVDLLRQRSEWIKIAASEGGLFGYGSDEAILQNLEVLHKHTPDNMRVVGSAVHDTDRVNPSIPIIAEISGLTLRLFGSRGIQKILKKTAWELEDIQENNPNELVFALKKRVN